MKCILHCCRRSDNHRDRRGTSGLNSQDRILMDRSPSTVDLSWAEAHLSKRCRGQSWSTHCNQSGKGHSLERMFHNTRAWECNDLWSNSATWSQLRYYRKGTSHQPSKRSSRKGSGCMFLKFGCQNTLAHNWNSRRCQAFCSNSGSRRSRWKRNYR